MMLKEETVSIYTDVSPNRQHDSSETSITLDEFHGNVLLLINFLRVYGFIELGYEAYAKMVKVCSHSFLQVDKDGESIRLAISIRQPDKYKNMLVSAINEFDKLVTQIKVVDKTRLFRLLSMGVVSSGANDYFVLKLLAHLHEQGANFEILLSRHGVEFIEACERFVLQGKNLTIDRLSEAEELNSFYALRTLIHLKIITSQETIELYELVYKNHLKLISYETAQGNKNFCIFSHADTEYGHVKTLAKILGVSFADSNVQELSTTLDSINNEFSEIMAKNRVHCLYAKKVLKKNYYFNPMDNVGDTSFANYVCGRESSIFALAPKNILLRHVHACPPVADEAPSIEGSVGIYCTDGLQKTCKYEHQGIVKAKNTTPNSSEKPTNAIAIPVLEERETEPAKFTKKQVQSQSLFCLFPMDDLPPKEDHKVSKGYSNKGFYYG